MTEHNRKILTKKELERGLNDIADRQFQGYVKLLDFEEVKAELNEAYTISELSGYNRPAWQAPNCTNSNCIRRNKCAHYKHKKGFSKPGVMIDNGNSCKRFKFK